MAFMELQNLTEEEIAAGYKSSTPKESTFKDYADTMSPFALKGTRPELRTSDEDYLGKPLDVNDETFKELVDISDVETQKAMYGALSNEHAYKIWTARDIQREALGRVAEDPLVTQLAYGAIPALASPTTLLPIGGAAATIFKVGKGASRMTTGARAGLAAGAAAGVANVGDEYMLGQQDLQTDYVSALVYGMAFGGPLGFLGGALAGPQGKAQAANLHGSSDTYKTDFVNDPDFIWTEGKMSLAPQGQTATKEFLQARGSTSTERQKKLLTDRIPILSDFLNSDIAKAYMHESAVGRAVMTKLVTPTTSLFDKAGNAIAIGRTAMDFKLGQRAINSRKDLAVGQAFNNAQKNGYMGSKDDFLQEVTDLYHTTAQKQEDDLADFIAMKVAQYDVANGDIRMKYLDDVAKTDAEKGKPTKEVDPTELDTLAEAHRQTEVNRIHREAREEFYKKRAEFNHKSKDVVNGAEAYRAFFNDHLKTNKELGMKGTMNTNINKMYAPKLMNWDNFGKDNAFYNKFRKDVYRAFETHKSNRDLTPEDLKSLTDEYVDTITNVDNRMMFTHGSFLAPTLSGDARMKGRKFVMNEDVMAPYRLRGMDDLTGRYHYQMSGRQSVQYAFGREGIDDIMAPIIKEMLEKEGKVSEDMVKYIKNTILDMSGQLRMNALSGEPAWQLTRTIQVFNSARLGGGFGGNQFIEGAAAMFMNHLPSVINGRFGKSFKNVGKVLYTKGQDMDEFSKYMINSGFLEEALHPSKVNRFADTEAGFNSGVIEKGLHGFTDWMYKWNGMRYFKGVMEDMAGGALMAEIPRLAAKESLTKNEMAKLARWGLDKDTFKELADDINNYYKPDEGKLDLKSFSDISRDSLQLAIQRNVAEVVIQGDSLHLPTWFKVPTPMKSLLTQFMRFPMIAHNVYMRRGMSEDKAKMAAAVVGSVFTFMGMKYVREQAALSLGLMDERDAKYDYFDGRKGMDNMKRAAIEATNYTAPLGMWTTASNYGSNMILGTELGSDYRGMGTIENFLGPTLGGLAPDLLELTQEIANDNITDERTALKAKSLLMGANLPIINEALKYSIEEGL